MMEVVGWTAQIVLKTSGPAYRLVGGVRENRASITVVLLHGHVACKQEEVGFFLDSIEEL